jgi:hypothetical protein
VPASIVRHEHAASSKEGSALFTHYVERNRFLTLARNAPWAMLTEALRVFLRDTLVIFKHQVLAPVRPRGHPDPDLVKRRLRAVLAFAKLLPATLRARRAQRVSASARQEIIDRWAVPQ